MLAMVMPWVAVDAQVWACVVVAVLTIRSAEATATARCPIRAALFVKELRTCMEVSPHSARFFRPACAYTRFANEESRCVPKNIGFAEIFSKCCVIKLLLDWTRGSGGSLRLARLFLRG